MCDVIDSTAGAVNGRGPVPRWLNWSRGLLVAMSMLAASTSAWGQINWIDPNGGAFDDEANWDPVFVPGESSVAEFNVDGTYTVDFNTSPTNLQLRLQTGVVTFDLTGQTYTLTFSNPDFGFRSVEIGDQALLTIIGGTLVSPDGSIASSTNSVGVVEVAGSGAAWTMTDSLIVGEFGIGHFILSAGGDASNSNGIIGHGQFGRVRVGGDGSTWTNTGTLRVGGDFGLGLLSVSDGGDVFDTAGGGIGHNTNTTSTALVTGAGSTWTSGTSITVGVNGAGELTIEDGGLATSPIGSIGWSANATGQVVLRDAGSRWTVTDDLYVGGNAGGQGGFASLTVHDGATVFVADRLKVWGTGEINLFGGTLHIGGLDRVVGGEINYSSGTVRLTGDRFVGSEAAIAGFFGDSPAIALGKELAIDGQATLQEVLTLDGGTFTVGSIVNADLLEFNAGTFRLTQDALVIGPGVGDRPFGDTLALTAGKHVDVLNAVAVLPAATLDLGVGGRLSAGDLTNAGRIIGSGRIDGPVVNLGDIEAIGTASSLAEMRFTGPITNTDAGDIFIRDGVMRFDGGLTNHGLLGIAFSGTGRGDVFGDIDNQAGGQIIVSGNSNATFYDNLTNNGELRLTAGTTTVFFGNVSGAGDITGDGTAFFEGSFSPGNSPGVVSIAPDAVYGTDHVLIMELGATAAGTLYDRIIFNGEATFGGTLDVRLIDLDGPGGHGVFTPKLGDIFDLFDFNGAVNREFARLILPSLSDHLSYDVSHLYTTGTISVIPEPTTLTLLGAGVLLTATRGS